MSFQGAGNTPTENTKRSLPPLGLEFKRLVQLGTPIALSHLATMAMQIVDTMFVGRLGAVSLGGVSLGNAVFVFFMIAMIGLLLGLDFLVSKAFGARKLAECSAYLVQTAYLVLIACVPVTVIMVAASHFFGAIGVEPEVAEKAGQYLRVLAFSIFPIALFSAARQFLQAVSIAAPVMWILVLANLFNIVGNWVFVFGHLGMPSLGVVGSALSTLVSRILMFAMIVYYLYLERARLHLRWRSLDKRFSWPRIREVVRLGAPAALQLVLEVGAFAGATLIAGRLGAVALAAHQVVLQVASLTFMVPLGIASAGAVLIGQAIGAEELNRVKRLGWLSLGSGAAVMACFGVTLFLFSEPIMRAFTTDTSVIAVGGGLLLIAAFFQLADGLQVVASGVLRGVGNTKAAMFANLVGHWALGLPVSITFGFALGWGIRGIWAGLSVGLISVASILVGVWTIHSRKLRRLHG